MTYDHNITITVPATQAAVARKVGMALDPDSGGADSWQPVIVGYTKAVEVDGIVMQGEPIYGDNISVSTPCRKEFAEQVPMMLAHPEILFAAVAAAFAERFPDEDAPTLAECVAFCKAVIPEPVAETFAPQ